METTINIENLLKRLKEEEHTETEVSPVQPDYRIVHRKDGVYDLYDSLRWLMSRKCIDDILNFLSTSSKYSAIRIVFEDKSFVEDSNEKTS